MARSTAIATGDLSHPHFRAMTWNQWIRQIHRWISIVFTVVVLIVTVLSTRGEPAEWVYLTPLLPLALLALTGLYLFALPYFARRREARRRV